MSLIFLALTILILVTNMAAVAAVGHRITGNYAVSKLAGVLTFCLLLFFIEHYVGLGSLAWLWPLTTAASAYCLYRYRSHFINSLWRAELVFIIGFLYGLSWKLAFPDIDGGSEALTDLSFVSNYLAGTQLPPEDNWLAGNSFNFYYAFQHYCAALMGRMLNLSVGYSYNLACAIAMAFIVSLTWSVASTWCRNKLLKIVLLVAVVAGGTGVSPFVPFMYDYPTETQGQQAFAAQSKLWASVRYIGKYDAQIKTEFGKETFGVAPKETLEMPLETIGYLTFLSDYHPPIGCFVLLLLALACIYQLEKVSTKLRQQQVLTGILVSTGPLVLITNTWVLPLQALLVFGWLAYRQLSGRNLCLKSVIIGGLAPLLLAYPFLFEFTSNALSTPLKLVSDEQRAPLAQWLLVLWPQLTLLGLAAFVCRRMPLAAYFLAMAALFLLLTELLIIDDPMGGKYDRFNTTLKWWSWTQVFVLVGLSGILLAKKFKWIRWLTLLPLLALSSYSIEMANYFIAEKKASKTKLHGHHWLTKDAVNRQILEYLTAAPRGVVLEGLERTAYTPSSALALFSNQASFAGWPSHEKQWRGNAEFIYERGRDTQAFYKGQLENSLDWLQKNNIQYIVYRASDRAQNKQGWMQIQRQVARDYVWLPFKEHGDERYGIWQRKTQGSF